MRLRFKRKRLEPSTPNLVDIRCVVVARHAMTLGSKGQKVKSEGYAVITCAAGVGIHHMSTGLLGFSSYYAQTNRVKNQHYTSTLSSL